MRCCATRIGAGIESWQLRKHERGIALVQASLSAEAFANAWKDGERLPLESAIDEALVIDTAAAPRPVITQDGDGTNLSAREREVLKLLTDGLSDRKIAESLSISTRTVNYHVTNLLTKLGVDSRTAAAALAVRQGLD